MVRSRWKYRAGLLQPGHLAEDPLLLEEMGLPGPVLLQEAASGAADAVMFGKAMMRDPHFALRAAHELGADTSMWPPQYVRARPDLNDGEW